MTRRTWTFKIAGAAWVLGIVAWVTQYVVGMVHSAAFAALRLEDLLPSVLAMALASPLLVPAYLVGVRHSRTIALVGGAVSLALFVPGGLLLWSLQCGPDAVGLCAQEAGLIPAAALLIGMTNLAAAADFDRVATAEHRRLTRG